MIKLNVLPCTMEEVMREAWRRLHTKGAGKKKKLQYMSLYYVGPAGMQVTSNRFICLMMKGDGDEGGRNRDGAGKKKKRPERERERDVWSPREGRAARAATMMWLSLIHRENRSAHFSTADIVEQTGWKWAAPQRKLQLHQTSRHRTQRGAGKPSFQEWRFRWRYFILFKIQEWSQPKCKPWWIQSQISRGLLPSTGQKCNSRGSDYIILTSFLDRKWATGQGFAITAIRPGVKKK